MNRRTYSAFIGLILWIAVSGCERPFIERRPPDIEVLSPDLDLVQTERTITIEIRATSTNDIDSVLMNGVRMNEATGDDAFSLAVTLNRGVNDFEVQAFGSKGTARSDTIQAVFLPGTSDLAEFRLPEARGGHTATRLLLGDLLVVGGSVLPTRPAVAEALLFDARDPSRAPRTIPTRLPRMEHTATRLPNGRVLIIGGSIVAEPTQVEQLVETVELYHPGEDSIRTIPVGGDPVRRSSHTTVLFQVLRNGSTEIFLYLFGGFGDITYLLLTGELPAGN